MENSLNVCTVMISMKGTYLGTASGFNSALRRSQYRNERVVILQGGVPNVSDIALLDSLARRGLDQVRLERETPLVASDLGLFVHIILCLANRGAHHPAQEQVAIRRRFVALEIQEPRLSHDKFINLGVKIRLRNAAKGLVHECENNDL